MNKGNIAFACSRCGVYHEFRPVILIDSDGDLWPFCSYRCLMEWIEDVENGK